MARKSPALKVNGARKNGVVTLSTGIKARIKTVPVSLLQKALATITDPPVPTFTDENGRVHENPAHPDYAAALRKNDEERNEVGMDVMALFGVELVDGVPKENEWIEEIKFFEKISGKDILGEYDLENEREREFVYKRFVAIGAPDYQTIGKASGVNPEEVMRQLDSFQDSA